MDHAAQASQTVSEQTPRSREAVIADLGGEELTGSGFEAEEPEAEFEEEA